MNAGIFINPRLNGSPTLSINPDVKNPMAPNNEIIKPTAADVPIAFLIGYPKYRSIGTLIIAPVMPIGADTNPEKKPHINLGAV